MGAVTYGILWSVMALGVFMTYRVLNYSDLTVEGSYTTGGSVGAILITMGVNPFLASLAAFGAGCAAGWGTSLLHNKLKIPGLLAGILSMTALWSVNLHIMGKANIALIREETVFTIFERAFGLSKTYSVFVCGLLIVLIIVLLLWAFLNTEIGYALRATGNNEVMIRSLGVNTEKTKAIGLILCNGLVALAGSLICQYQKFADISMGTGVIVIGLASVIIGEVLIGRRSVLANIIAVVVGAVIYRFIVALVLWLGLPPNDLKLFTAIIVALCLALPYIKDVVLTNINNRKSEKEQC
jgi:putative ABC transport system permease protein